MSKEVIQEYVEIASPIDDIQSSHSEKLRSREYGNETAEGYQYSEVALKSIYKYWTSEQENPLRSDRSKVVAKFIVDAVVIEMYHRNQQIKPFEEMFEE